MARFILDEDVPASLAVALKQAGHEASRVQEVGLRGAKDRDVLDFAHFQQATLITADVDLADVRTLHGELHYGLMLLRMPPEMPARAVTMETMRLLDQIGEKDLESSLVVLEPGRVRIRRVES